MRYTPDAAGIGEYLKHDPELKVELHRRAQLGMNIAQALAPVLQHPRRDRVRGALAASPRVVDDGVGGIHHDRMQLSVVFEVDQGYAAAATWPHHRNPDPHAHDYLTVAIPVMEKG